MRRLAIAVLAVAGFLSDATLVSAQVLYGAASGSNSPLYIVNPATGATTSVGNIGLGVTGLAEHPTTGVLYGVTALGGSDTNRRLISIDKATGAGSVIGSLGRTVADITFRADGTLFGWTETGDDLVTINLTTGAATVVGNAGISTAGSGLAFDKNGTLYFVRTGTELRTINPATGVSTLLGSLTGSPTGRVNSLTFHPDTNVAYAVVGGADSGTGARSLITLNTATFARTLIGSLPSRFDALAFGGATSGGRPAPTLSEIIPATGSTAGGTSVTLRGSDFSSDLGLTVTLDGILATNIVVVDSSTVTATTPAHAAGAVNVTVRHTDGKGSTLTGGFTYGTPPGAVATLTVQRAGTGNGRVVSAPAGISCGADCSEIYATTTQVTLTAVPGPDATFAGWTGDIDCADGIVLIAANQSCTARFERLSDRQALDIDGDGRGDFVGYAPAAAIGGGGALTIVQTNSGVLRGADFNGDRRSDLFSYDPATGSWSIDLGAGPAVAGTTAARQSPIVVDITGDGLADVAYYDATTGQLVPCVAVSGGLDCRAASAAPVNAAVQPLDLNGDGRGDVLTYRWSTGDIGFLLGSAAGTFQDAGQGLNVGAGRDVLVLDINGDGRSDLVVSDPGSGVTTAYVNTGGGFSAVAGGTVAGYSLFVANLDGDANADLIGYDNATGQTLQALNAGNGFTVVTSQLPAGRRVSLTDVNGDRRTDLLLYDAATGAVTIATSQANGSFTLQQTTGPTGLSVLTQQGAP